MHQVHQCRLGRRLELTSQAPTINNNAPTPAGSTVRPPVLASDPGVDDWATGKKLCAAVVRLVLSGRID
jgi:hypothetical protein